MLQLTPLFALCLVLFQTPGSPKKDWSDKSGTYQFDATLVAFDDNTVVLKSTDKERMNGHELISRNPNYVVGPIKKLSRRR